MKNLQGQFDEFFKSEDMEKCKEFVFKYKYLHRALQNVNQRLNAMEAHQHWLNMAKTELKAWVDRSWV